MIENAGARSGEGRRRHTVRAEANAETGHLITTSQQTSVRPRSHPGLSRGGPSLWAPRRLLHQAPPEGDWRIWLLLGGRGAGKTRAAAEWVRAGVERRGWGRLALVGPTHDSAREVMIEGPSGLIAIAPSWARPAWQPSRRRLEWPNGAVAYAFSAEEPDGLRGPQFHAAWGDEFCAWRRPQQTLDMLLMTLRLGQRPRLALTTTPRPIPALKRLTALPGVELRRGRTADASFLPETFRQSMQEFYGGGRLGAQELDGEIVDARDGALWTYAMLEAARGAPPAHLDRIVVAVDPPVSTGARADACGIVVAGAAGEGLARRAFVLADASCQGRSPQGWARAAAEAFDLWRADLVVAEANQGGDLVESVLRAAAHSLPVRLVRATRGKAKRAEPAAALYERGQVIHCGVFAELEAEMRALGTGDEASDDRVDALVWALADLMLGSESAPRLRTL